MPGLSTSCSLTSTCPVIIHGRASSTLSKMPRSASKASSWHLGAFRGFDIYHHSLHSLYFVAVDGMSHTWIELRGNISSQLLQHRGGLLHTLARDVEIAIATTEKNGCTL